MWGNKDPAKDDWQAVSSPLDVGEPATAVDIAPEVTKNSRWDKANTLLLSCLSLRRLAFFNETMQLLIIYN